VAGQGRYFNADENHYQLDLCLFLIFFAPRKTLRSEINSGVFAPPQGKATMQTNKHEAIKAALKSDL
jgi:hypothetical protein